MNLAVKQVSVSEMSRLTGATREFVTKRLSKIPFTWADNGKTKSYNAREALRAFYLGEDGAVTTREALEIKKAQHIDLQMEVTRGKRIPLDDIRELNDEVFQNIAGILKGALNKVFTSDRLEDCMAELRRFGEKVSAGGEEEPSDTENSIDDPFFNA